VPKIKIGRRKAAMVASEKALLDVVRRRDSQRSRRSPAGIGYPTLIRH